MKANHSQLETPKSDLVRCKDKMTLSTSEKFPHEEQGFASITTIRRRREHDPSAPERSCIEHGWIRDKAIIDGDDIVLKPEGRTTYYPEREDKSPLLAFASLDTKDHNQICQFVKRFGLLFEDGFEESRESIKRWAFWQIEIKDLLELHYLIGRLKNDDPEACTTLIPLTEELYAQCVQKPYRLTLPDAIEEATKSLYKELYEEGFIGKKGSFVLFNKQKNLLLALAISIQAYHANKTLEQCYFGVSCYPTEEKRGGSFSPRHAMRLDYNAPNLFCYLYLQMAMMAVDSVPIRKCECGKYFQLTRTDKKHCSPACGGNTRSKTKRAKDQQENLVTPGRAPS